MITRIFRVQIKPALHAEFEKDFSEVSLAAVKTHAGLAAVSIGKPTQYAPDEYVMISTWQSLSYIKAFAGQAWHLPVIPVGMEHYVVECWVHHFEEF